MTNEPATGGDGDERVGTVLAGRYRILSRLGEGAMGAVYLGEHIRIGRRDAIKVLRPAMARDEEAIARFTRGARNASGIRHRNVCAIYDFGTTEDGLHFLAMEYVDGGNLTDLLVDSGALALPRAVAILTQAAGALEVAHGRGIVHRDLKPDNIMLARESDGSDLVKVVDFDISKGPPEGEGAQVTRHGYVVGTPEYMSPEQLTGDPLGPASDVYSLALVFFRMLTGRLPFDGGTAQEVMVNRLTVDPLPLAEAAPELNLPEELEAVLRKALARRAEERWGSAVGFADAVRRATGESGVAAAPVRGSDRGGRAAGAGEPAGAAGTGSGDAIPSTRVSSTADGSGRGAEASRPAGSAGAAGADRRRTLLVGGGAALVAVIILGGLGLTLFSPFGSDAPAEPSGEVSGPAFDPAEPEDGDEADPASDPVDSDPPTVATDDGDDDTTDEVAQQDDPGDPPPADDPPPTVPGPAALPFPSGAPGFDLDPDDPSALLRQLVMAGTTEQDSLTEERLAGVRDSAWVIYSSAAISRPDSALAAYLVGSSMIPLGDSIQGVRWLTQAVRLDRVRSYVNLLERHGGGGDP